MQITQRVTLLYQDEKSDKVYEVDLAQVGLGVDGAATYMVNFRYGKRGKTMKEGSETVAAVPLAEARRAFDKLVGSKTKKGYRDVTGQDLAQLNPGQAAVPPVVLTKSIDPEARSQAILAQLQAAVNGEESQVWPVDRVIWRSGVLRLQAAVPLLQQLLNPEPMRRYCVIWALGRCGDDRVVGELETIYRDQNEAEHVRRIALEAIFQLSPAKKAAFQTEILNTLPQELKTPIDQGNTEALATALQNLFNEGHVLDFVALDRLYQIDNEITRPVLLEVLRTAPFEPSYFQRLRHIFKAAEYRCDAEVFAILGRRFERDQATYRNNNGYYIQLKDGTYIQRYTNGRYDSEQRRWIYDENPEFRDIIEGRNPKLAFSNGTKAYLERRIWRSLKALGDAGDREYTNMAAAVLLQYSDADAEPARDTIQYRWDYRTWTRHELGHSYWDRYAKYFTLNQILYRHSPRYEWRKGSKVWACKAGYKPGDPAPNRREEAFPKLWTDQPETLLYLLLNSRCQPVQEFAIRAIRTCTEFCHELPIATLLQLLAQPYAVTAQFAFDLAQNAYDAANPNLELVGAIANCAYEPARNEAYQWIQAQPERLLTDAHLASSLITSPEAQTRRFVRTIFGTVGLSHEQSQAIVARVIALIVTLADGQNQFAAEISETLLLCFQAVLRSLDLRVVLDLLRHPLVELQSFAAQVLLIHETEVTALPEGLIEALLNSPQEAVRVVGVQLFGRLPDDRLIAQMALLQTFLTHEMAEVREAIRPTIRRLATNDPEFRQQLVSTLLTTLQHPETDEAVQGFLLQLLQQDIPEWMAAVPQENVMALLQTQASAAQEMGGHILQANYTNWASDFTAPDIVQLTHHQVQSVRRTAQSITQLRLSQIRKDSGQIMQLVNIFESDWDDTRGFGMTFFGEWLKPEELTPAILINICDSNRADVRKFGRDLVSQCFQTQDGQEYLMKFSEHPANDMQLFTTQYLETYASGNADRIAELAPYFTRVLGQINRARVAKQRIFAFLDREATQSKSVAQIVAEILTRQSATIAVGDKAKSIEILLKIHQQYPDLAVPIVVKPVALATR